MGERVRWFFLCCFWKKNHVCRVILPRLSNTVREVNILCVLPTKWLNILTLQCSFIFVKVPALKMDTQLYCNTHSCQSWMGLNKSKCFCGRELARLLRLWSVYCNYTAGLLERLYIVFHREKNPASSCFSAGSHYVCLQACLSNYCWGGWFHSDNIKLFFNFPPPFRDACTRNNHLSPMHCFVFV